MAIREPQLRLRPAARPSPGRSLPGGPFLLFAPLRPAGRGDLSMCSKAPRTCPDCARLSPPLSAVPLPCVAISARLFLSKRPSPSLPKLLHRTCYQRALAAALSSPGAPQSLRHARCVPLAALPNPRSASFPPLRCAFPFRRSRFPGGRRAFWRPLTPQVPCRCPALLLLRPSAQPQPGLPACLVQRRLPCGAGLPSRCSCGAGCGARAH